MKKILSRIIIGSIMLWSIYTLIFKIFIQPCLELHAKYGLVGIYAWLIVLAITGCVLYVIIKIILWSIDNC